jgi:hypothetical protein
MGYELLASTGNLIDWFDSGAEARAALQRIVDLEPEHGHDVALLVHDDDGRIIEGPIHLAPTALG